MRVVRGKTRAGRVTGQVGSGSRAPVGGWGSVWEEGYLLHHKSKQGTGAPRGKRLARHRHIWGMTSKVAERGVNIGGVTWRGSERVGAGPRPTPQSKSNASGVCAGRHSQRRHNKMLDPKEWRERGGPGRRQGRAGRPGGRASGRLAQGLVGGAQRLSISKICAFSLSHMTYERRM